MGIVRTVLGDIDSSLLGFTMAHEHVFFSPRGGHDVDTPWSLWRWDEQYEIVKDYKAKGGGCLVDAGWSKEAGRSPEELKKVSELTGVHIIACTGTLGDHAVNRERMEWSIDEVADFFEKEVTVGMDDTDIKAGWIKGSSQYMRMTAWEEKALRAGCRAAKRTGVAVHTHTTNGTWALEQMEIVKEEGLPFTQFGIAHIDRNPDYYIHKKILETGAYVIYDGPGKAKYFPDSIRIDLLKRLCADGFGKQIMLSNDMGKKEYHAPYGGGPGLMWIKEKFLPRLLDEGFTQEQIDDFMIHNPARFYSLREPVDKK